MKLNKEQTTTLLKLVASSKPDGIDCDGCMEHMAEFVECELLGTEIPQALDKLQRHIDQCPCCGDEHNALLEALQLIEQ